MRTTSPIIELHGVTKKYPGVVALEDVDLALHPGEVTALAGENGAGKSTLIKVIAGAQRPDSGSVLIAGREVGHDPRSRIMAGVSVIYQELTDVLDMSIADNLLLGRAASKWGFLTTRRNALTAREALSRVGLQDLDENRAVGSLSLAQRQLVEIARCLARDAKVLVFDEPTSSLSDREVDALLATIRELKRDGLAILYVSHHLAELFGIADQITVMRDGAVVASRPVAEWTEGELVRAMLARNLDHAYPWEGRERGQIALRVDGVTAQGVANATLHARAGEIVGLVGLAGAGRTELMRAIAGVTKRDGGVVMVGDESVPGGRAAVAYRRGVVYVSEDRKRDSLLLDAPIRDNMLLGLWRMVSRAGWTKRKTAFDVVAERLRAFRVKIGSAWQRAGELSGGNQQKVILARLSLSGTKVALLDDPTRGVDVGSKSEIYTHVLRLASTGVSVLLTSSDTDEVLAMSDRIYVLREGSVVAEVERGDFDRERVLAMASIESRREVSR